MDLYVCILTIQQHQVKGLKSLMSLTRLEELKNQFSDVPESIIIKSDVLVRGIRRSEALEEAGSWALPQSKFIFHWDREKLKQGDIVAGRITIPEWFQLGDGTTVCVMLDDNSPYTVNKLDGQFFLAINEENVAPITFQPMPAWYTRTWSDGTPLPIFAAQEGADSVCSVILHHCQYFNTDEQCRFCNFNKTVDLTRDAGRDFRVAKKPEQVAEAYRQAFKENSFYHVRLSGGSHIDRSKEAEIYEKFIKSIKIAIGKRKDTLYGEIVSQGFEGDDAALIHDTGIEGVCWNMEQWDPFMFETICPGKARTVGRERWIQILKGALDYWDVGKVTTSFVVGPEMVPPHGFTKIKEGVESWLGGFEELLTKDICPRFNMWSPDVGSIYQDKTVPPTEYFLEVGLGLHRLFQEYGMYPNPSQICYKCGHRSIWPDFYHLM